ncbi:MAG: site-specific DNA-methyltransferase [Melioribacteraceae bacterium]|jgi:DNA modification methylase|nr:site-specific DNA-methyltransferase [Melioribacteraceae bacterium]
MKNYPIPRIDRDSKLHDMLLKYCRISYGDIWIDKKNKHKVGCLDSNNLIDLKKMFGHKKATLALHDPPYNMVAFQESDADEFVEWSKGWIDNSKMFMQKDSSLYVWLGADQKNHFQPFAEFILMLKNTGFKSRSFITMRNQRGYGTQQNWMSIRQELLYYTLGNPEFNIESVYTDIPKVVKGYYKEVAGKKTENLERSKSDNIRSGNVWIDIQQVFHLLDENVNGCFAQKPLKAIKRVIDVSSSKGDLVIDFFAHSGTTLLASEILERQCYTTDIDPIYCEISIRRLENFRNTGNLGWQNTNPFEEEIKNNKELRKYLKEKYSLEY